MNKGMPDSSTLMRWARWLMLSGALPLALGFAQDFGSGSVLVLLVRAFGLLFLCAGVGLYLEVRGWGPAGQPPVLEVTEDLMPMPHLRRRAAMRSRARDARDFRIVTR
jgi:hypothetical protein